MKEVFEKVPIYIVLRDDIGLEGAFVIKINYIIIEKNHLKY